MKTLGIVLIIVAALCGPLARATPPQDGDIEQIADSLHWIKGPQLVEVGRQARFKLPAGFYFLDAADSRIFLEKMSGTPGGVPEYVFGPEDLSWYGVFSYSPVGHVADDEKLDARALLRMLQADTSGGGKPAAARSTSGGRNLSWQYQPFYDPATRRLEWATSFVSAENSQPMVDFDLRILGREGFTQARLVVGQEELWSALPQFKNAIGGYAFVEGQRYEEFRKGERSAGFGLAALVVGQAAMAAGKGGLIGKLAAAFAASWKFIASLGLAALAALYRFFRRAPSGADGA
jgi:uncharacterized membrane-anchored protein